MNGGRAIVVGAGFGGLSAAITLARAGLQVEVFEAQDRAGGRAAALVTPQGFHFDMGPTLLIMIDTLRDLLGDAFADLGLARLQPNYRVLWEGGDRWESHSDAARIVAEFRRFQPAGIARALEYIATVHEQFVLSRKRVLEVDMDWRAAAQLVLRPQGLSPWVMRDLRGFARTYFTHPRLVEALTFQPLYLGMSPRKSPAMYALLGVEEMVGGVWFAPGGTGSVVAALRREAERLGCTFTFGARVERILTRNGRATGVVAGGAQHDAQAVVVSADREPALAGLFGTPVRHSPRYGHSAAVFYLGLDRPIESAHHTVLLPDDPWAAYAQLDAGHLPNHPLIYMCNPAISDPAMAPPGMTSLMLLVPVPNARRATLALADVRAAALDVVERTFGPISEHIVYASARGPREFGADLGLAQGAAFGPDHGFDQMGPLRPAIAHPTLANVAFAGSGTHPGSGVPMVLISGRLAAERVLAS